MCWPSGENATELTQSLCPVNGPPTVSLVKALQTRMVLSFEPETMHLPSGENATDLTDHVCPINGPATVSPVVEFHTQIV